MKPLTKATPLTMLALLTGGCLLFGLNGFFPVPIEAWLASLGIAFFITGMLYGLYGLCRGVSALSNSTRRQQVGVWVPVFSVLIAIIAWSAVAAMGIRFKRAMDERIEYEQQLDNEHENADQPESQQLPGEVRETSPRRSHNVALRSE